MRNKCLIVCSGVLLLWTTAATANVNLEFRPATQTVTNNTIANVEVYAVSDNATNQAFGFVQVVFTWDQTVLELVGQNANGPYNWFSIGFPSNGVNLPLVGGIPANDGDAVVAALAQFEPAPLPLATPSGLLVTTLQFKAIDTVVDTPVAIAPLIGGTATLVLDLPAGGVDVTGTLGPPALITSICNVSLDCDDGNDCSTDTCTALVCSHGLEAVGTACGDPTDSGCDNPDTCDGAGVCLPNLEPVGFACGSPADTECDNPDTCDGAGTCLSNLEPVGLACGSPNSDACDAPDTCDGAGACAPNHVDAGAPCGDPTDTECNQADLCDGSGVCQSNLVSAGSPCGDPSNTACTDPDTCDGGGFCVANDFFCLPPNDFCIDDGTGMPVCVQCIFGDDTPCDDGNFCTADFCGLDNTCHNSADPKNGLPCPDALFCNGVETCQGGACVSPPLLACDDSNPCTDDICDEATDTCSNPPNDANDPDDGLFCNGLDTCQNGVIIPGSPPDCNDANECTDDSCDDLVGSCVHVGNANACDDGQPCTFNDACVASACVGGPVPPGTGQVDLAWVPMSTTVQVGDPIELGLYAISVDAIPDEIFSIDVVLNWDPAVLAFDTNINNGPYTWLLSFFPGNHPLNATFLDGDAFYSGLSQLGIPAMATPAPGLLVTTMRFDTVGLSPGTEVVIAECGGPLGTTTRVDGGTAGQLQGNLGVATVQIVECFTSAACDDGVFCNGEETCVANSCVPGVQPCDDGNICTDDVCSEAAQACQTIPLTGDFDQDGLFCTGIDRCEAGVFVPGEPVVCDDGNICTTDSCDDTIDACTFASNTVPCDDADPCTDSDTCSGGVCFGQPIFGCVPCEFDSQCDDLVSCTANVCDQALGVCTFIPDDTLCPDDGIFCNGVEFCLGPDGDPGTGCASSGPPCNNCSEALGCACDPPLVEVMGNRYLRITPQPPGTAVPTAFVVTSCGGTNPQYVGPLPGTTGISAFDEDGDGVPESTVGSLVVDPVDALWLTPAEWGGSVFVTGEFIKPDTLLDVQTDCGEPGIPNLTAPTSVTMSLYGDIDLDGNPTLGDVLLIVLGFQNNFTDTTRSLIDLAPCATDQVINIADVFFAVLAFQGTPPFDFTCEFSVCAP
ncbi:MAG: hypothetical protein ACE5E5_07965 [Phycisphaerae bacterium]